MVAIFPKLIVGLRQLSARSRPSDVSIKLGAIQSIDLVKPQKRKEAHTGVGALSSISIPLSQAAKTVNPPYPHQFEIGAQLLRVSRTNDQAQPVLDWHSNDPLWRTLILLASP